VLRLVERGSPKYEKATLRWPTPVSRRLQRFAALAADVGRERGDLGIEQ
jgi:hypothetical protein